MDPYAATAIVLAVGLLVFAWWLADQLIALRNGSPWVVYLLRDSRGWPLYVGQTNDLDRRLREHLRGPDTWRAEIAGASVARHCRGDRQSRRCERRMIRAMVDLGRWRVCPEVHNEVVFGHGNPLGRLVWPASFLCVSLVVAGPRFHRPAPVTHTYAPRKPQGESQQKSSWEVVDVSSYPTETSADRIPSPGGGCSPLDLLVMTDDTNPSDEGQLSLNAGPPVKRKGGRPRLSDEERVLRRRETNRRSQAKRRGRVS